ncbi:MAG TPA: DUF1772 domain-containing protein [Casimicrobiaceae bacterium]|nr:DUF1772 domain-containing protein [Casimicrobiaceae bacterium]
MLRNTIVLWLFVIALGLDIGAGIYEGRIVVPLWSADVPATLAAGNPYGRVAINAGILFWSRMTSVVALLALVTLAFSLRTPPPLRTRQIVASVAELVAVAMTLFYFRPTLVRLFMGHGEGLSPDAIRSTVGLWVMWSRVRIMVSLVAWCAAIQALVLSRR